jgi:(4S)-4-hydroxy-5-phosphonooxypentane-2,3-dione isomerase
MSFPFILVLHLILQYLTPSAMAFSGPIALNVKVKVRPEHREEFVAVIQRDARETLRTEPGALQFVIGEDSEERNVFYFHEQYKSLDDVSYHKSTAHFQEWVEFQKLKDPFEEETFVVNLYRCGHEPTPVNRSQSVFCLNVQLCIRAEVREEFLQVIENNQNGSRGEDEPLCLQYDFGEDLERPNVFHFHEEYIGKEGFDAHTSSPHFAAWEKFAVRGSSVFTEDPIVAFYKTI